MRLYEPPLVEDQGENNQIPFIEDFSLEYLDVLQQDTILIEEQEKLKEEILIIFGWVSKVHIHQKPNGLKWGR